MADNLVAKAFTGGKSFMTNHYAIWRDGLAGQNPNWYAIQQGNTYIDKMFYSRSMNEQSSYYKFLDFLEKIERKESQKEKEMILIEIEKIKKQRPEAQSIKMAERAVDQGEYGLAYTFLLQNEDEIEQLVKDYQGLGNRNISHTNLFWDAEFSTKLANKLEDFLNNQKSDKLDLTIEEMVEEWLEEGLTGPYGLAPQALSDLKNTVLEQIRKYFLDNKLLLSTSTKNKSKISKSALKKILKSTNYYTAKGKERTPKQALRFFTEAVTSSIRGLSQEASQTKKQASLGFAFNTGKLRKEIEKKVSEGKGTVQIKADTITYIFGEAIIDVESIVNALQQYGEEDVAGAMAEVERQLLELQKDSETKIFRVATNIKGYRSRHDLQIEGKESFLQRTENLRKIATTMPNFSMDKLIFMLNNTMPGCLNEKRQHHIIDYLAAICMVWMWDDYTELFSVDSDIGAINTVHMFASGGIYYSASQILKQTRENLINQTSKSSFVNIEITPPKFNAEAEYEHLMDKYPVDDVEDYKTRQNLLASRWNEMRDKIEREGQIGIYFKQKELEDILGNLSGVLGL